jgi:hypothetical protein
VRRATRLIIEERFPCAFAPVCLDDHVEAGVALLEVPLAHRRAVAPPSWFERLFDEERRRTRALGTPSARDRAHIPTRLSSRNRT